jgi:hypothetical protein
LRRLSASRTAITIFILLLAPLAALGEASPAIAAFAAKGFPDNADLRGKLFSYVIGASKDVALNYGEKQLQSAAGQVTVRVEKRSADFIIEFLNPSSAGPGAAGRGSCYIQRGNAKGNYILQARILLEDDPSCYLALYPSGSGTRGDVVMYGAVVKKGLFLSDMIYRILLLSFSDIVDATSRSFDWSVVFKFAPQGSDPDYAGELRSAIASAPAPADKAPAASSAPIGISPISGRVAYASAPALPATDPVSKAPRSLRIAASIDKADSAEALLLDLASYGESGARELSIAQDTAPPFADDKGDPMAKPSAADFPRYDSKGLVFSALRAAVFVDLQDNPGSVYALLGDGLRATLVPTFDEAGRLGFSVFSGGKETSWDDLAAGRHDLKVRIVRVPS